MPSSPSFTSRRVPHELRARVLDIIAVERIGPRMQRITLGGDQLEADFPAPAFAAADHVKVVLPDPLDGLVPLRGGGASGVPRTLAEIPTPVRDYTVRSATPGRLVLDFVLHEHGPMGLWATRAQAGTQLGVLGPRGSKIFPNAFSRYVLIADETALPAVGRWLDEPEWTAEVDVHLLVQSEDEYPLPRGSATSVTHHVLPPGSERTDALAELASALRLDDDTYVWAAGEADSLRPLRRGLRARGLPRERHEVDGYWRLGTANLDHHAVDDDD